MDYLKLKELVPQIRLFDLYRLQAVIANELEVSRQVSHIKNHLAIGDKIEYLSEETNQMISAIVLQKNPARLLVANCHDQQKWWIRYYMLNLSGQTISPSAKLDKTSLAIGERVGFVHEGHKLSGKVIRLNPKTATIITDCDRTWRVGYGLLFTVIDAEVNSYIIQS